MNSKETVYDEASVHPESSTVFDPLAQSETVYDGESTLSEPSLKSGSEALIGSFHPGNTVSGIYTIVSWPIHGGMGTVWKALHTQWDRNLAIKRPKPEYFNSTEKKKNTSRKNVKYGSVSVCTLISFPVITCVISTTYRVSSPNGWTAAVLRTL